MTSGAGRKAARSAARPALALLALLVAASCGGVSQRPQRTPAPQLGAAVSATPDVAQFARRPDAQRWQTLHAQLLRGPISPTVESRLVDALIRNAVPSNVVAAAAVDLATLDWGGTMQWVQKANVAARAEGNSNEPVVRRSSALAWLLLSLRPAYADDAVDLTHADLRAGPPPAGLPLNLQRVDFSGSRLAAMSWHDANLTDAVFEGTTADGALTCAGCRFGTLRFRGTAVFTDGTWLAR